MISPGVAWASPPHREIASMSQLPAHVVELLELLTGPARPQDEQLPPHLREPFEAAVNWDPQPLVERVEVVGGLLALFPDRSQRVEALMHGLADGSDPDLDRGLLLPLYMLRATPAGEQALRLHRLWQLTETAAGPPAVPAAALLADQLPPSPEIEPVDGGFVLRGKRYPLTGRPMAMLKVLLSSPHLAARAERLRQEMGVDDETVSEPDQVVRDAAADLRKALRKATGLDKKGPNPLPSEGRGEGLAYRLDLP
jgi:hypothetical protein